MMYISVTALDTGMNLKPKIVFQEAASLGVVPRLNYTAGPITLNAEMLPSYVAEVNMCAAVDLQES